MLSLIVMAILAANPIVAGSGDTTYTSPVRASYPSDAFGGALANAANSDPNTAMYCRMDDAGGTSIPNCGLNAITHQFVGPYAATGYFSSTSTLFQFVSDWQICMIVRPTTVAAGTLFDDSSTPDYFNGTYTQIDGVHTIASFRYNNSGTSSAYVINGPLMTAGATNVLCWGKSTSAGLCRLKVNGAAIQNIACPLASMAGITPAYLGSFEGGGDFVNSGISEFIVSTTTPSDATFTATESAAMNCRTAGKCLPEDAGTLMHFSGDQYVIGASWYGDVAHTASKAFALTGQVLTSSSRYNWPSLAWTQTGTVPKVTASALYPQGYESRHSSIGPFSDTNYLSYGSGLSAMHLAQHTGCVVFNPSATATDQVIFDLGGSYIYSASSINYQVVYGGPAVAGTSVVGKDNVLCWGREGTNIRAKINASAVGVDVPTVGWVPGATTPKIGRFSSGGYGSSTTTVKEFFYTSTAPTAAFLTSLTDSVTGCTHPGPCLPDDAGTVMHCYTPTAGGKWLCPVNTGASQWTQNGTIPKVADARYTWPAGVTKADAEGAGPFSDSNYFGLGAGADVFDFASDFSCCGVFQTPTNVSAGPVLFDDSNGTAGWMLYLDTTGAMHARTCNGGGCGTDAITGNAVVASSANIGCWGKNGATKYSKLNGGTVASSASAYTQDTTTVAYLGRFRAINEPFAGSANEFWCSSTPASDALFTRIQSDFMAHTGSFKEPMSVTRTTDATYVVDNAMYRAPAGALRSTSQGKLYEGVYVNVAQYSEQLDNAIWVATTTTVTADQGVAMDGTTTLELVNTTNATAGKILQLGVNASSTTLTASAQFRADTATKIGTVGVVCNGVLTATAGACWRSDGGACTAALALANNACIAYGTFDTTKAVRMSIGCTCSVATTGASILVAGGQYGAATGQLYAGAAQLEVGLFPHQYCGPTLNATKTCNADAVTVNNPLRPPGVDWTNLALQSETMVTGTGATAPWQSAASSTIAVAQDVAIAPDRSMTADEADFGAITGAGTYSVVQQPFTSTAAPWTGSVWMRTVSGSGTLYLDIHTGATNFSNTACSVSTTWTRCSVTATLLVATSYFSIGPNLSFVSGQPINQPALSVYLWGAQVELGTTPSPYCPTLAAAATCSVGGATGKVVTNVAWYSEVASGHWLPDGASSVSDNNALCPVSPINPNVKMTLVVSDGAGDGYHFATAAGASRSVYMALVTGDAACTVSTTDGAYGARYLHSLTATPTRFADGITGTSGFAAYQTAGTGCARWCATGNQVENATFAGPYCGPTGAAAKTCAPEQHFAIRIRDVMPENGVAWNSTTLGTRMLWHIGDNTTQVIQLYCDNVSCYADYYSTPGYAGRRVYSFAHGLTDALAHSFIVTWNNGVPAGYVDGAAKTTTDLAGTTSGLMSQWSPFLYLTDSTAIFGAGNNYVGSIDMNSTGNVLDFP